MTLPDVVLHIGLHKTATRFVQRALLHDLDSERFLVNPEPLGSALKRALRHPGPENREAARFAARHARRYAGERTLVVSDPTISGDMYSHHDDWQANLEFVRELFPDARVLYFVRRHSDWLQSAYRQGLVKGPGVPIEFFLNFRDGAFRPRTARRIGGARNIEALGLRFLEIYRGYARTFGADHVYLFRQEDLRHRPDHVRARLAQALGLAELRPRTKGVSSNRSFSALAIQLFFPGVHRWPNASRRGDPRQVWLRRARGRLRKVRAALIRHVFDRLVYRDWDLLARNGMRERIDRHYAADEQVLARVADVILRDGPSHDALTEAEGVQPDAGVPARERIE